MNIIMLDFDGVLNSSRTMFSRLYEITPPFSDEKFKRLETRSLDPVAIKLLQRLCDECDASIVITSTWRVNYTLEQFKEIFEYYGWKDAPIISATPYMFRFRGKEVNLWFESNTDIKVENYVIIDDDSDFFIDQPFVKVSGLSGFSAVNYMTCKCLLGKLSVNELYKYIGWYLPKNKSRLFTGDVLSTEARMYLNEKIRKSI